MIEDFDSFFISKLTQIEDLYIPKLEGNKNDFIFNNNDPFSFPSSPKIIELRKPLLNCLECWSIFSYGEDYEKEPISCQDYRKGDIANFKHNKISKYIPDAEFKKIVTEYIKNESKRYYRNFDETLLNNNTDANQKRFISKIFEKSENAIRAILDNSLNKYNEIVAGELIKSYIKFIEKIIRDNKNIFPDFFENYDKQIEDLHTLYESNFGYINELDEYIYRGSHQKFLNYEEQLFPQFLTSDKIWNKPKNDLVKYYLFLDEKNIFKKNRNKAHLHILRFLADRYSTNLQKQTDPNRIAKLSPNKFYDYFK